jgi:hypothetical protein
MLGTVRGTLQHSNLLIWCQSVMRSRTSLGWVMLVAMNGACPEPVLCCPRNLGRMALMDLKVVVDFACCLLAQGLQLLSDVAYLTLGTYYSL